MLQESLKPDSNIFNSLILYEKSYKTRVKNSQSSSLDIVCKDDKLKINKYSKSYDSKEGYRVDYQFPELKNYGRVKPVPYTGLSTFSAPLRGFLANGIYIDVDMVNCHPVIMNYYFQKWGIDNSVISEYVNNREDFLKTEKMHKKDFLSMINDSEDKNYSGNIKTLHNQIYELFLPKILKTYKEVKIDNRIFNPEGKIVAAFLQSIEFKILCELFIYCRGQNIFIDVLMHDGFFVRITETVNEKIIQDSYLDKFSNLIFDKFGIKMVFKIKEHDLSLVEKLSYNEPIVLTDSRIAEIILEEHSNEVFKFNGLLYFLWDYTWSCEPSNYDFVIEKWISQSCLNININSSDINLVKDQTSKWNLYIKQIKNMCWNLIEDKDKGYKLDSIKNIIPFKNGIYDFKSEKFTKYDESDEIYYFTSRLNNEIINTNNSKLIENMQKVKDIFIDLIGTEEELDEIMSFFCRALSGNIEDKQWLVITGERSSGKGLIQTAFSKSFSGTIGIVNSLELTMGKNTESAERRLGFLETFTKNLLNFSQEVSSNDNFDGTILKIICSGGDEVVARASYGKTFSKKIRGSYILMCQNLPDITPIDAKETLLMFNMPNKYVDKLPNDNRNCGFNYKLADNRIKSTFDSLEMQEAFIMFIFSYFKDYKPIYEILKENTIEDNIDNGKSDNDATLLYETFYERYNVTCDKKDTISSSILLNELGRECKSLNARKLKKFIESQKCTYKRTNGRTLYCGLVPKYKDDINYN